VGTSQVEGVNTFVTYRFHDKLAMSQDSLVVPAELRELTPEEVDFLDAVISRAGPAATTFLPILKAYSTVLEERQMDPQETIYYAKLLKLGTMGCRNWGDRWELVRQSQL